MLKKNKHKCYEYCCDAAILSADSVAETREAQLHKDLTILMQTVAHALAAHKDGVVLAGPLPPRHAELYRALKRPATLQRTDQNFADRSQTTAALIERLEKVNWHVQLIGEPSKPSESIVILINNFPFPN